MNEDIESRRSVDESEVVLYDAALSKLAVKPGDIVKLTIPLKGNRWGIPRINKLSAAVRRRGAELAVLRADTTLEITGNKP